MDNRSIVLIIDQYADKTVQVMKNEGEIVWTSTITFDTKVADEDSFDEYEIVE